MWFHLDLFADRPPLTCLVGPDGRHLYWRLFTILQFVRLGKFTFDNDIQRKGYHILSSSSRCLRSYILHSRFATTAEMYLIVRRYAPTVVPLLKRLLEVDGFIKPEPYVFTLIPDDATVLSPRGSQSLPQWIKGFQKFTLEHYRKLGITDAFGDDMADLSGDHKKVKILEMDYPSSDMPEKIILRSNDDDDDDNKTTAVVEITLKNIRQMALLHVSPHSIKRERQGTRVIISLAMDQHPECPVCLVEEREKQRRVVVLLDACRHSVHLPCISRRVGAAGNDDNDLQAAAATCPVCFIPITPDEVEWFKAYFFMMQVRGTFAIMSSPVFKTLPACVRRWMEEEQYRIFTIEFMANWDWRIEPASTNARDILLFYHKRCPVTEWQVRLNLTEAIHRHLLCNTEKRGGCSTCSK